MQNGNFAKVERDLKPHKTTVLVKEYGHRDIIHNIPFGQVAEVVRY